MKKSFIVMFAAVSLSSCGIYNKYQRPADIRVDGLYGEDVGTTDTTSIASLSWRQVFTDPQLQQLVDSALANNTDLLSAQQRIKEAEATLMSSRLAYLPSFMLTPQGGVSSFDKAKGSWTYTGVVSASWEVDIFGKLTNAKRRDKALYAQSLEYEQAVTTSLIANVANLYYTLLMLDEQQRISQETVVKWRESVRTMRALMEVGMTNEAMNQFGYGYCAGVLDSNPDAEILQYNVNSFGDAAGGKSAATSMIADGADIIFHAAGGTGLGVIESCKENGIWAVGVDSDQSYLAPESILTSAMKRVDNATYEISKACVDGNLESGIVTYDLKSEGVDIAPTTDNLPEEVLTAVEEVKEKIKSGELTVPGDKESFEAAYGDVYTLD